MIKLDIKKISGLVFNKVAVMPRIDHDNELFVGSRTRAAAFDINSMEYRFNQEPEFATATSEEEFADMIIKDCAKRDYHYQYLKQYN